MRAKEKGLIAKISLFSLFVVVNLVFYGKIEKEGERGIEREGRKRERERAGEDLNQLPPFLERCSNQPVTPDQRLR